MNGLVHGGLGNDTYFVDDETTLLVEQIGEGSDHVQAWVTWTMGAELENLSLRGGRDINGTGSFKADALDGNSGDNTLRGLDGKDFLYGNGGDDRLSAIAAMMCWKAETGMTFCVAVRAMTT